MHHCTVLYPLVRNNTQPIPTIRQVLRTGTVGDPAGNDEAAVQREVEPHLGLFARQAQPLPRTDEAAGSDQGMA